MAKRSWNLALGLLVSLVAVLGIVSLRARKVIETPPNSPPASHPGVATAPSARPANAANHEGASVEELRQVPEVRALLSSRDNSLKKDRFAEGMGVRTTQFQHYYKGLEVIGARVMVHDGPAGRQVRSTAAPFELDTHPAVKPSEAKSVAREVAGKPAGDPELKILPPKKGSPTRLIYVVSIVPRALEPPHEVWVDAKSGKLIADIQRREQS